jgi:hypothetical protein
MLGLYYVGLGLYKVRFDKGRVMLGKVRSGEQRLS